MLRRLGACRIPDDEIDDVLARGQRLGVIHSAIRASSKGARTRLYWMAYGVGAPLAPARPGELISDEEAAAKAAVEPPPRCRLHRDARAWRHLDDDHGAGSWICEECAPPPARAPGKSLEIARPPEREDHVIDGTHRKLESERGDVTVLCLDPPAHGNSDAFFGYDLSVDIATRQRSGSTEGFFCSACARARNVPEFAATWREFLSAETGKIVVQRKAMSPIPIREDGEPIRPQ
jgi:hypothetical protein